MSFSFKNLGHAFSTVATEIVTVSKKVAAAVSEFQGSEKDIEAVTALISPQAAELERAAFMALGLVAQAANDVADVTSAHGLNLTLDVQTISDFKAIASTLKEELAQRGIKL